MSGSCTGDGRLNAAVRGDDEDIERAVQTAGAELVPADDADVVLTPDESSLLSLLDDPVDAPALPISPSGGLYTISRSDIGAAVEALLAGDVESVSHPVLALDVDGERVGRALLDVTLMTSAPARISEYTVSTSRGDVSTFRSDGVVAASPLGSGGYASAAGGAVLGAETGLSVVPVAPFSTQTNVWVLEPPLSFTVERTGDVSVFADGHRCREVGLDATVYVKKVDTMGVLCVSEI